MKFNVKIPEDLIYKIWEDKRYELPLATADGLDIEVIDPGTKNSDLAGPDYHNARVRIGNITFTGDVEIDPFHSDWKAHGHHLNQRYNKTILHAVLSNNSSYPFVLTQNGRKVPTLELEKFLQLPIKQSLALDLNDVKHETDVKMPCIELNSKIERREKLQFIKTLGLIRFKKKCERYLERIKELIILDELQLKEPKVYHDFQKEISSREFLIGEFEPIQRWQQLFYEQFFEALGYAKNKDIMMKLSRAVEIKLFKTLDGISTEKIESILFNVSGLMPAVTEIPDEETSEYLRKAVDHWNEVKLKYDSLHFNKNDWHFFKLRPQNFPTVRLAAGARFLNKMLNNDLFGKISRIFEHNSEPAKIISKLRGELITKGDGYWASHFNFSKPSKTKLNYFIGIGRADEIIVNIILPIYSVYFEIFNKKDLSQKVLEIYLNFYQKEGNHLVDQVNDVLGFKNEKYRSVYYQGMIDLFRSYCIKQRCMECEIGKKVFN